MIPSLLVASRGLLNDGYGHAIAIATAGLIAIAIEDEVSPGSGIWVIVRSSGANVVWIANSTSGADVVWSAVRGGADRFLAEHPTSVLAAIWAITQAATDPGWGAAADAGSGSWMASPPSTTAPWASARGGAFNPPWAEQEAAGSPVWGTG